MLRPISALSVRYHLDEFNKRYLGLKDFDTAASTLGEVFYACLTSSRDDILREVPWISSLPSKESL